MEDPSMDWEMVDYYPSLDGEDEVDNGKSKLMGRIINGGLSLGKKVVITGFVMSSVPIVLPPLVVISALGLAFSVPFGAIFASYACTQKLMSKLLPSPSPPLLEYQTDEEKEQTQEGTQIGMALVDNHEEIIDGDVITNSNPELLNINEEAHTSEIQPSLINGVDSNIGTGITAAKSDEDQNNTAAKSDEDQNNYGDHTSEFIPIVQPHRDNGEEIRDKFVQPGKSETNTGIEGASKDKEGPTLSKRKGRKKNHGKKKDISESKGESKASSANNLNLPGEMVLVQETSKDELSEKEKQEKPVGTNTAIVLSTRTDSNRPRDNYNESRMRDNKNSASTKLKHDEGIPGMLEPKNAADEGPLSGDKIWKQLDAIRVIVGFKAARQPSYFEELKALYLFTGIEPPSSMGDKDSSDPKEFHDRLCFLMSVIGLKSQSS